MAPSSLAVPPGTAGKLDGSESQIRPHAVSDCVAPVLALGATDGVGVSGRAEATAAGLDVGGSDDPSRTALDPHPARATAARMVTHRRLRTGFTEPSYPRP